MTYAEAIQRRVSRMRGNRTRQHVKAYERTHSALKGDALDAYSPDYAERFLDFYEICLDRLEDRRKPWWRFWA